MPRLASLPLQPLLTRRGFMAGAATLPLALRSLAETPAPRHILLGTLNGEGILRAGWNAATGELRPPIELAIATANPTYLALHPRLPVLYAANEKTAGDGTLSAFRLGRDHATLTLLNQTSTHGNGPTYLAIQPQGRAALAANYGGGTVVCAPLAGDGSLLPVTARIGDAQPHGPNAARQEAAHMHCTVVSPDGGFVLACDLGSDAILIFRTLMQPATEGEQMTLSQFTVVAARPGSGPRHLAFHPNGRWVYVIHELDCTLELFDWSVTDGDPTLVPRAGSTLSTLAARDHLPGATACELQISPDGHLLYANTRGEDSLCTYRIDARTGLLRPKQRLNAGGHATRYFTLDPTRRWLLCAQQTSDAISIFAHDPVTGYITPKPRDYVVSTPMFMQFV